jgi:uncharacterized LabA/DUF88 family protein
MELHELKTHFFMFDPESYGRIFAFIDFGNVRPWAKDLWAEENKYRITIEVDIAKLSDLCSWVKSKKQFFYYGYFPQSESANGDETKYRNSIFRIDKARKCGFSVQTKEIKMIPQYDEQGKFKGKFPKCNFDVEMTMDMITKIDTYDTTMLFSGDSDFGGLLQYLKSKGKRVVIISTRNRMSKELQGVADLFIPAETLEGFLKYTPKTNTPPLQAEV